MTTIGSWTVNVVVQVTHEPTCPAVGLGLGYPGQSCACGASGRAFQVVQMARHELGGQTEVRLEERLPGALPE